MDLEEAIAYIESIPKFSPRSIVNGTASYDLIGVTELLHRLSDPQDSLRYVHIAGTNGKGSLASFLSSILMESGLKTGLYTSPYLNNFTERIRINGIEIGAETLSRLTERVKTEAEAMEREGFNYPSEFEIVCAIAFLWFKEEHCDIVVLEVGLGGRLDATNVIKTPLLAAITTISLDHTEILGDTLPEIAAEKAGIIKEGGRVLLYPQIPEVRKVFEDICNRKGALLIDALMPSEAGYQNFSLTFPREFMELVWEIAGNVPEAAITKDADKEQSYGTGEKHEEAAGPSGTALEFKESLELKDLHISLLGRYQIKNAAMAVNAALILRAAGLGRISDKAIRTGLEKARWRGRFELLREHPALIIDGSHNPEGARALAESLSFYYPDKKIQLVSGVLADKDYGGIMEPLLPLAEAFYTITPPSPRALSAEELAEYLSQKGAKAYPYPSVHSAVRSALKAAGAGGVVCAFGSLYFLGEIRLIAQNVV